MIDEEINGITPKDIFDLDKVQECISLMCDIMSDLNMNLFECASACDAVRSSVVAAMNANANELVKEEEEEKNKPSE